MSPMVGMLTTRLKLSLQLRKVHRPGWLMLLLRSIRMSSTPARSASWTENGTVGVPSGRSFPAASGAADCPADGTAEGGQPVEPPPCREAVLEGAAMSLFRRLHAAENPGTRGLINRLHWVQTGRTRASSPSYG